MRPKPKLGDPLTEKQREVLTMIVVGQRLARAGKGRLPTIREMCLWSGLESPGSLQYVMDTLEKKGYIRVVGRRAIEVLR
jgi:SOS-response transcriptional repressor LexA